MFSHGVNPTEFFCKVCLVPTLNPYVAVSYRTHWFIVDVTNILELRITELFCHAMLSRVSFWDVRFDIDGKCLPYLFFCKWCLSNEVGTYESRSFPLQVQYVVNFSLRILEAIKQSFQIIGLPGNKQFEKISRKFFAWGKKIFGTKSIFRISLFWKSYLLLNSILSKMIIVRLS